ncbi:MAG TPA: O-antigen ligase family protein [Bacillota bacterium]|nr:O-antigen ligase family protein [Bacillota bacterium]
MKRNWIERYTGFTLALNPLLNIIGIILLSIEGLKAKGLGAKIKADKPMWIIWTLMAGAGIITIIVAADLPQAIQGFFIPFVIVWLYILGRWVIQDPATFVQDSIRGATILSLITVLGKLFQLNWTIGAVRIITNFANGNHRGEVLYVADNLLGLLVQVGIIGALGSLFLYWKEKKNLVENIIAVILNVGALVITESRGAMMGTVAGILFLVICYGIIAIVSAGLFASVLFVFSRRLRVLFLTKEAGNNQWVRLEIWRGTLKMIKDHLLFGVGGGGFLKVFQKYRPASLAAERYDHVVTCAHNNYLSIIAAWGIVGGVLFLGWQLVSLVRAIVKGLSALQKIVLAILISFFVHVLVNDLVVAYWGVFLGLMENPYFKNNNSQSLQPK